VKRYFWGSVQPTVLVFLAMEQNHLRDVQNSGPRTEAGACAMDF
jgi:hypothetical protein